MSLYLIHSKYHVFYPHVFLKVINIYFFQSDKNIHNDTMPLVHTTKQWLNGNPSLSSN